MVEIKINRHLSAMVGSAGVEMVDDQHGTVTLAGDSLERIYAEYLREKHDE